MNRITTAACKLNDRHYFYEKDSISQGEKKCLAFRCSLHNQNMFIIILGRYWLMILPIKSKGGLK